MTKLWHPLLKLNFWFSGRVMWPRVEHCRFERFRVERPAFSGRNNGTAFQLRLVHSRNCSIKLCAIYGISVSKLIMEWFFIKLLIKWTYLHACTCCDSEEINESSFESMRATSGRSATRSVRPEGVQGVIGGRPNCWRDSFLPRTIRDWNNLDACVVKSENIGQFKTKLAGVLGL